MLATPVRFGFPTTGFSGAKGQWFKSTRVYLRKSLRSIDLTQGLFSGLSGEFFENVSKNRRF